MSPGKIIFFLGNGTGILNLRSLGKDFEDFIVTRIIIIGSW